MAENDILTFRVALEHDKSICRDIEIEDTRSLYKLAEAIVAAFDFDFDHAFGFYHGDPYAAATRKRPRYELFADMGEADPGVLGVKKTKIAQAFPAVGHTMLFLFDYGDDWCFRVRLTGSGRKDGAARYPRIVARRGEAPPQYPDADDLDEDGPGYGINLATGEKIRFGTR